MFYRHSAFKAFSVLSPQRIVTLKRKQFTDVSVDILIVKDTQLTNVQMPLMFDYVKNLLTLHQENLEIHSLILVIDYYQ